MSQTWADVDGYIEARLLPPDPVLEAALAANRAAGLPAIDVTPAQGKLLQLLVRLANARRVLEIGTLGGYSSIWMARGLAPGGQLVTIEFNPEHARAARQNIERAGLAEVVDVLEGRAIDVLPTLAGSAPFDVIFIDADKPSNAAYLEWAVRLSRPGTVIVVDNVIREGRVVDARSRDGSIAGSRDAFDFLGSHPRLTATALQTVGGKGYDGFAIALVSE